MEDFIFLVISIIAIYDIDEELRMSFENVTYLFSRRMICLICPKSGLSFGSSSQHFCISSINFSSEAMSSNEGRIDLPFRSSWIITTEE